ncbi:2TM domain-containing protein [Winogradskyella maritima]|nr:2TM domain-containing protein [Winogradskyella maritima]
MEDRRSKKSRAKKRVAELKGFYTHATVFTLVNLFVMTVTVSARISGGESFNEAFFSIATFSTPFFWVLDLFFMRPKFLIGTRFSLKVGETPN